MNRLEEMRDADIRTVEPEGCADIREVRLDHDSPERERLRAYLAQIGNPYCFRCGELLVKLEFAETAVTMEDQMYGYFERQRRTAAGGGGRHG